MKEKTKKGNGLTQMDAKRREYIYRNYPKCYDDEVASAILDEFIIPALATMPHDYPRGEKDYLDFLFNIYEISIEQYVPDIDCLIKGVRFERNGRVMMRKDIAEGLVDIEQMYGEEKVVIITTTEWDKIWNRHFIKLYKR